MTSRVERVEALKAQLGERDYTTASELAAELGVSVRTLHRDLAMLRNLGIPVDSDRGRGGGLRLEHGWSLGRVHLNESEAIGLLLSLTIAEKVGSPLLLQDTRSIARKIATSFAPAQAGRILALRKRILVGAPASTHPGPVAGITARWRWRRCLDRVAHVGRLIYPFVHDNHGSAVDEGCLGLRDCDESVRHVVHAFEEHDQVVGSMPNMRS